MAYKPKVSVSVITNDESSKSTKPSQPANQGVGGGLIMDEPIVTIQLRPEDRSDDSTSMSSNTPNTNVNPNVNNSNKPGFQPIKSISPHGDIYMPELIEEDGNDSSENEEKEDQHVTRGGQS